MSFNRFKCFFFITFLSLFQMENGFYVPGVAPKEFMINEIIDVRVSFIKLIHRIPKLNMLFV